MRYPEQMPDSSSPDLSSPPEPKPDTVRKETITSPEQLLGLVRNSLMEKVVQQTTLLVSPLRDLQSTDPRMERLKPVYREMYETKGLELGEEITGRVRQIINVIDRGLGQTIEVDYKDPEAPVLYYNPALVQLPLPLPKK